MEYRNLSVGDLIILLVEELRLFNEAPDEMTIVKAKDGGYRLITRHYEKD